MIRAVAASARPCASCPRPPRAARPEPLPRRGLRDRRVSVPAILITSHPNQNLRDRAAAVGAGIVEKPLLGDALIESISDIVAR